MCLSVCRSVTHGLSVCLSVPRIHTCILYTCTCTLTHTCTCTHTPSQEAYKMVDEAKGGKVVAEKRLADAAGKVREYTTHTH